MDNKTNMWWVGVNHCSGWFTHESCVILEFSWQSCEVVTIIITLLKIFNIWLKIIHIYAFIIQITLQGLLVGFWRETNKYMHVFIYILPYLIRRPLAQFLDLGKSWARKRLSNLSKATQPPHGEAELELSFKISLTLNVQREQPTDSLSLACTEWLGPLPTFGREPLNHNCELGHRHIMKGHLHLYPHFMFVPSLLCKLCQGFHYILIFKWGCFWACIAT